MTSILFVWTIVAACGGGGCPLELYNKTGRDWRPLGEFANVGWCEQAAKQLGLTRERYRCIETGKSR